MSHRRKQRKQWLYRWHYRVGLLSALIIMVIASTGLLLNHNDGLGLSRRMIDHPWVLSSYGMQPQSEIISYHEKNHWVSWLGESVYIDAKRAGGVPALQGTYANAEMIITAGKHVIDIYTAEGNKVEQLTTASLPPGEILKVGKGVQSQLLLNTTKGLYQFDEQIIHWKPLEASAEGVVWSSPAETPENISDQIFKEYRGEGLPLARIILDIHSGRIFGLSGKLLADITAIALLFLSITGVLNWIKRGKRW